VDEKTLKQLEEFAKRKGFLLTVEAPGGLMTGDFNA
jgi:hypothetical protein